MYPSYRYHASGQSRIIHSPAEEAPDWHDTPGEAGLVPAAADPTEPRRAPDGMVYSTGHPVTARPKAEAPAKAAKAAKGRRSAAPPPPEPPARRTTARAPKSAAAPR